MSPAGTGGHDVVRSVDRGKACDVMDAPRVLQMLCAAAVLATAGSAAEAGFT